MLPSPVKGPMTKLPDGTYGNFPDKAVVHELFEDEEKFVPPVLLTRTQLIEQLGQDVFDHDPLWFLYDARKLPCLKNIGLMTATSGILFSGFAHYLFKARRKTIFNVAASASLAGFAIGTSLCIRQHIAHNDYIQDNKRYRTRNSYGLPEVIQRERDATVAQAYQEQGLNTGDDAPVIPASSSSIASIFPLPPPSSTS